MDFKEMSIRYKELPVGLQEKNVRLFNTLRSIISIQKFEKFDIFVSKNHNSILDLISYTLVLISEIIKKYPQFIKLFQKFKYRITLLLNYPTKSRYQDKTFDVQLSKEKQHLIKLLYSIYGYIIDIKIAQGVFKFIPYITIFLKNYSTLSKLKTNVNTIPKLEKFIQFILFAACQFYESNGFLTSHGFIPSFKSLLLPHHQKDSNLTPSDWFYVYSCRFWFVANIMDTIKTLINHEVPSFNLICDDVLSLHWGSPNGFLRKDVFAIIGFLNMATKFKKLL